MEVKICKICKKCNIEKPLSEFYVYIRKRTGMAEYSGNCKKCIRKPKKEFKPGFKRCTNNKISCEKIKPIEEFEEGRSQCKKCKNKQHREWTKENSDKVKNYKKENYKRKRVKNGIPENHRICVCFRVSPIT